MKRIHLVLLSCFLLTAGLVVITSCEKETDKDNNLVYTKTGLALTGAQETPPNPAVATGSLDVTYRKDTRTLSYTVSWNGLTAPMTLMHIHGPAEAGFAAGTLHNIVTPTNGVNVASATKFPAAGSYTGSVFIDGFVLKEVDLLSGKYYINIHTPMYPSGEIRAQIVF